MKLPQLSLRELFLLVVIASMGCGWWVYQSRLQNELHETQGQLKLLKLQNERLIEQERAFHALGQIEPIGGGLQDPDAAP